MSPLLFRASVFGIACLLSAGCDESAPGGGDKQGRDLAPAQSSEAIGEGVAARIGNLETRLAALEARLAELSGLRSPLGSGIAPREVDRPPTTPMARQMLSRPPGELKEVAQRSPGLGQAVDFTTSEEGQIFPRYGARNMIVKTSAGLGLTSASSEPVNLVFSDFSLAERIEVIVSLRTGFWTDQQIRLLKDDRLVIAVTLSNYDLKFGDHVKKRSTTGWKRGEERNQLRIAIENNNAWLYINKQFFGVQEIELTEANRLEIRGIKRDQDFVYSVSVQPLS